MSFPTVDACIFCKIISGEMPCFKVYEDEKTIAFMDIFPAVKGHTLVLHKGHYETLFDMSADDAADVMRTVHKVAAIVKETIAPDGVNILQNNYPGAGQTVPHYHVHILPRTPDDGLMVKWNMQPGDQEEIAAMAAEISGKL